MKWDIYGVFVSSVETNTLDFTFLVCWSTYSKISTAYSELRLDFKTVLWGEFFLKLLIEFKEGKVVFFQLSLHERKTPENIHLQTSALCLKG